VVAFEIFVIVFFYQKSQISNRPSKTSKIRNRKSAIVNQMLFDLRFVIFDLRIAKFFDFGIGILEG
ncbi:MAG TPA: hypothetical protein PKJ62_06275, partial [Bacteroidia bacterium]|nr:hypothetical protein [Bacteroidia bacterium]